ncbi:MAG: LuxR C-terminal-related transcriptional regulator [Bradyrhizobium sp.]|jgi:DNA-binding NarL/FixJ family response regulator
MSADLTLFPPLTRRERELITLIAQGMQNKNIAHDLHISEHTVRAHIGNIMRKYRLKNRTQIAMTLAVTSYLHPFSDESAA